MTPLDQNGSGCLLAAAKRQGVRRPRQKLLGGRGLCLLCSLLHPVGLGQALGDRSVFVK